MFSSDDLNNFENFDNKYPDLVPTLTAENFLEKIKEFKLSSYEIRIIWVNIIKDHNKVLTSIKSLEDLECISQAFTMNRDELTHQIYLDFIKNLIQREVIYKCIRTMDDLVMFLSNPYKYLGPGRDTDKEVIKLFNDLQDQFPTLMQQGFPRKSLRNGFFNLLSYLNPELLGRIIRENKEFHWISVNAKENSDDLDKLLHTLYFYDSRKEQILLTILSHSQSKKTEHYSSAYHIWLRKNEKSEIEMLPAKDWLSCHDLVLTEKQTKILYYTLGNNDQATFHYTDYSEIFDNILKQYYLPNAAGFYIPTGFDKEQMLAFVEAIFPNTLNCSEGRGYAARINELLDLLYTFPIKLAFFILKKIPDRVLSSFYDQILTWPCFIAEENKAYRDAFINHFSTKVEVNSVSVSDNMHAFVNKIKVEKVTSANPTCELKSVLQIKQ